MATVNPSKYLVIIIIHVNVINGSSVFPLSMFIELQILTLVVHTKTSDCLVTVMSIFHCFGCATLS